MNTTTASRPSAETATRRATRQTQTAKRNNARNGSTVTTDEPKARHAVSPNAADILKGLFTTDELAELHTRCKARGESPAVMVTNALRSWLATPAVAEDEDAHLCNDAPPAEKSRPFDGILGEEIGRFVDKFGLVECWYYSEPHFYFVFETRLYWESGQWRSEVAGAQTRTEYMAFLATLPPSLVRSEMVLEKSWDENVALEWFQEKGIAVPECVLEACEMAEQNEITKEKMRAEEIAVAVRGAIADERLRIATQLLKAA